MIFARDEGAGAAVVLIHGLGASSRVFTPLFERRAPNQRLIAFDLPRSGQSRGYAPSVPSAVAAELLAWLEGRRVDRFHLFGHSFGGLVALELARLGGERLASLTVASAPALGLPGELRLLLGNPLADLSMEWFGGLPMYRPLLRWYLGFIWGEPRKIAAHHLEIYEDAARAEGFAPGMLEALRAVGRFRLDPQALRGAPYPKHVLWGERDPLVPAAEGERLASTIGADLRVLDGVGHCVPEERPEAIAEVLGRCAAGGAG